MASDYIVDKEIAIIRERQASGEDVYFYPLLLTPTPDAGLEKVRDKNLRPRDAKPFSSFPYNDRLQHMNEAPMRSKQLRNRLSNAKAQDNRALRPYVLPTSISPACPKQHTNAWLAAKSN